VIKIRNLYKNFGAHEVLKNINLDINSGDYIALMGSNGSGKTTLGRIINCLLKKNSGLIEIDNINLNDINKIFEIRCKVGMVFQNPENQIVAPIVCEDIAFGLENLNLESKKIYERVDQVLKIVNMCEYKDSPIAMLSGGQKQKIAIAGVLAMQPDYIIFDEASSMIDDKDKINLFAQIKELNKKYNKTIIFITQNINEAIKFKRLIILNHGEIIFDNKPEKILESPEIIFSLDFELPFSLEIKSMLNKFNINLPAVFDLEKFADIIKAKLI